VFQPVSPKADFGFQPVSPKADFVFNLVAGSLFRPGGRGPPRLLENASGFCYASVPSLQTPEGFTRPPDGFQKPSSVLRGFAGWETLKCFEAFATKAERHEGRKKPLVSCFSLSRRRRISFLI